MKNTHDTEIQRLSDNIINRIAAGEVIERPASVVKELVENAIDAGASKIDITVENGGKSLIRVSDDGHGIPADELVLACTRHATSKLVSGLDNISTLGFRGEGLAAIRSVSRFRISSRKSDSPHGWTLDLDDTNPKPFALNPGTVVEVRDLFHSVPARQKFLRSNTSENNAIVDIVRRIAIGFFGIAINLKVDQRQRLKLPQAANSRDRIAALLGPDFADRYTAIKNAIPDQELMRCSGFLGLPHTHHINSRNQFVYINARPVRDKLVQATLAQSYRDLIPRGRFPSYIVFLHLSPDVVDVNVHPAKLEIRFRYPQEIRRLIVSTSTQALAKVQTRSRFVDPSFLQRSPLSGDLVARNTQTSPRSNAPTSSQNYRPSLAPPTASRAPLPTKIANTIQGPLAGIDNRAGYEQVMEDGQHRLRDSAIMPTALTPNQPLGEARCQIANTYIIAEHDDGIIIVDQHAAHERIIYERLKETLAKGNLTAAPLLTPCTCSLDPEEADAVLSYKKTLSKYGCSVEAGSPPHDIIVTAIPAMLPQQTNIQELIRDIALVLLDSDTCDSDTLQKNVLHDALSSIYATRACYNSIRAGRRLDIKEMNAILRDIETTPFSDVCNHGRPTHVLLNKTGLEKLFDRK